MQKADWIRQNLQAVQVFIDLRDKTRYNPAMIRERIKKWLKETGTTRTELAEFLLVSPATMDGWLLKKNPRPIPAKKLGALEAIMAPKNAQGDVELTLKLSPEEREAITADIANGIDKEEAVKKRLYAFISAAASSFRV